MFNNSLFTSYFFLYIFNSSANKKIGGRYVENAVKINAELDKYNKSVVSRNLIDYIIEQTLKYKPSSDFIIAVSKKGK